MDASEPGFRYLLFELVDPSENKRRFYYLAWQRTLFAEGAVVRIYGRKGGQQTVLSPVAFESLQEAWPLIRETVQRRLRHGYRIVSPGVFTMDLLRDVASLSDLRE
ncbi:MAG: WGR domain-containing protein [Chloroflexota bacterium]|nr:WGR domain-containing protein [Chloroflexota bacterium]